MEMAARGCHHGCHLEVTRAIGEQVQVRSRGPISADERHSYDEEEIGTRPACVK